MVRRLWAAGVLALVFLLCAGCGVLPDALVAPKGFATHAESMVQGNAEAALAVQLGDLEKKLNAEERAACNEVWDKLWPLRQSRLEQGVYAQSDYETRLSRRLRKLLDEYTIKYLDGSAEGFGYQNPPAKEVAAYVIQEDEDVSLRDEVAGDQWTEAELETLWADVRALLPEGAFADFGRFEIFTDGPAETLAYVYTMDAAGERWVLAIDPEDAGDGQYFTETILHEYFHYLSLNDDQVTYTRNQTTDTYNEPGMVSRPDSYLNDFYQRFWSGYLDDCLAGDDTYNFFLRHYDDFVSDYASTDPSEDICESFTYFVLYEKEEAWDVWEEKLNFFYDYPELVAFRDEVRTRLFK